MVFAGTRTRGPCGCCGDGCGVCTEAGNIDFCIRLTGIAADLVGDCIDCLSLNRIYFSGAIQATKMVLVECTSTCSVGHRTLPGGTFENWPAAVDGKLWCYLADYNVFGAGGIALRGLPGDTGDPSHPCNDTHPFEPTRTYVQRAVILKPGQAGMDPGTTELHYFIFRDFGTSRTLLLHAKYVFATIPVVCSFIPWTAMEIVYAYPDTDIDGTGECDWTAVGAEFQFGGDCETGGSQVEDEVCCEDTELPETLYVTLTQNGSSLLEDEPFFDTEPGFSGFQYDQGPPNTLGNRIQCDFSGGSPPPGTAEFLSGGSSGDIDLTVHSCSPFHATGTKTTGGSTYSIEIIE